MRRAPPRLPLWREAALASVSHSSGAVGHVLPHGAYPRSPSPVFRLPPPNPMVGGCTGIRENRADLTRRGGPRTPPFWPAKIRVRWLDGGTPPFLAFLPFLPQKTRKITFFRQKMTFFCVFSRFFTFFRKKRGFFDPPKNPKKTSKKRGQKWPKMAKNGGLPPPP